jgi:lipopolysaccharide export system protein LptA
MPLFSEAKDSVVEDFSNDRKMIYYYGDVTVRYGNLELTADYMEYNIDSQTVFARGTIDTSGNVIGLPKMKEGKSEYVMEKFLLQTSTAKWPK